MAGKSARVGQKHRLKLEGETRNQTNQSFVGESEGNAQIKRGNSRWSYPVCAGFGPDLRRSWRWRIPEERTEEEEMGVGRTLATSTRARRRKSQMVDGIPRKPLTLLLFCNSGESNTAVVGRMGSFWPSVSSCWEKCGTVLLKMYTHSSEKIIYGGSDWFSKKCKRIDFLF
jgi:hypothetical protein